MKVIAVQQAQSRQIKDTSQEELVNFAKALVHPTKLEILRLLNSQNSCLESDLVELKSFDNLTIVQHLKELKDTGLIEEEAVPPYIKYSIHKSTWTRAKTLFTTFFE